MTGLITGWLQGTQSICGMAGWPTHWGVQHPVLGAPKRLGSISGTATVGPPLWGEESKGLALSVEYGPHQDARKP